MIYCYQKDLQVFYTFLLGGGLGLSYSPVRIYPFGRMIFIGVVFELSTFLSGVYYPSVNGINGDNNRLLHRPLPKIVLLINQFSRFESQNY